jgi:hypothetical protein
MTPGEYIVVFKEQVSDYRRSANQRQTDMTRLITTLALALSLGLSACDADRVTSPNAGLVIEAAISDATIGPRETAMVSFRLRNAGDVPRSISLDCSSISAYIEDEDGVLVHSFEPIFCANIGSSPITLAPGEEIGGSFLRVTRAPDGSGGGSLIGLPPGRYRAYVVFSGAVRVLRWRSVPLQSPKVPFEIAG